MNYEINCEVKPSILECNIRVISHQVKCVELADSNCVYIYLYMYFCACVSVIYYTDIMFMLSYVFS